MTRQEKFVVLLVLLAIAERGGNFLVQLAIAMFYAPPGPMGSDQMLWENIGGLLGLLVNFGVGVWLYVEARAYALKSWCWAAFGLVFGLLAAAVFFVVANRGPGQRANA